MFTDIRKTRIVRVFCLFSSDAYSLVCYSVTENGFAAKSDALLSLPEVVHDADRVEYFRGYSNALLEAVVLDGVPVKSYFAWSEFRSAQPNCPIFVS